MEETININYIDEFEEYRKNNIFIINNILFMQYLNILYPNLVLRENDLYDENEQNNIKSEKISYKNIISNKPLLEKYITINTFSQYMGIQDLISERIFKYLDKSRKGQLTKNDFCTGIYQIFFGKISDLLKLTFFICDFNEDGKIYKSDMKLILAYIPRSFNSQYSDQQEYIKKINQIIDDFFNEISEENTKVEEIDFKLYNYKVTECFNDITINGAFFLFINLIKYIFINKPFNQEVIYTVNFVKNKHLLKVSLPKVHSMKLNSPFEKKALNQSEIFNGGSIKINNFMNENNNDNTIFNSIRKLDKKYTEYKINEFNKNLSKIQKKDLFSIKKSSSVGNIDQKVQKKYDSLKNDFIGAKKKEKPKVINLKENVNRVENELDEKNKIINRNSDLARLNSAQKLTYSNKTPQINNKFGSSKYITQRYPKNPINTLRKHDNKTSYIIGFPNSVNNKSILPSIKNIINQKKLKPDQKLYLKMKTLKLKNKNFNMQESSYLKENRVTEDSNKIYLEEATGFYLYKYSEEDYHISLQKYYAVINKKEILFFSSNLKNELCTIWCVNNTVISIKRKSTINKCTYYPINIIYRNNGMSHLLFEDKEAQIEFGKQLKNNIDNNNFEDEYETKEKIGEGNFAVVKKCIEKKSGKEYAVKIISKQKLTRKDLDLIIQEKNYMKLIKHPNIVSLKGDYEDEKYIYFLMEYYKGGDLYSYIYEYKKNKQTINEKSIAKIIKAIAQSIQYLHYFGIVHRDLKPENIVFATKNDISSLTIIDLGVAITLPYDQKSNEPLGTLEFISPEVFTHKPYDHRVDIWSIGIILYILITTGRMYPFDSDSNDKQEREQIVGKKIVFLQQEYPEEFFQNKSKYLISLIDKSLEKSPEKRISIDDFLKNYWLVNNSK